MSGIEHLKLKEVARRWSKLTGEQLDTMMSALLSGFFCRQLASVFILEALLNLRGPGDLGPRRAGDFVYSDALLSGVGKVNAKDDVVAIGTEALIEYDIDPQNVADLLVGPVLSPSSTQQSRIAHGVTMSGVIFSTNGTYTVTILRVGTLQRVSGPSRRLGICGRRAGRRVPSAVLVRNRRSRRSARR